MTTAFAHASNRVRSIQSACVLILWAPCVSICFLGRRLGRPVPIDLQPPTSGKDVPRPSPLFATLLFTLRSPCPSLQAWKQEWHAIFNAPSKRPILGTLALLNAPFSTFPPSFYFDGDRYHARHPATALFASESNTPSLTYMNLDTLQHARRQYFYRRASRPPFYDSSKNRVRVPFPGLFQRCSANYNPRT